MKKQVIDEKLKRNTDWSGLTIGDVVCVRWTLIVMTCVGTERSINCENGRMYASNFSIPVWCLLGFAAVLSSYVSVDF
jgi:hypothetical protein